MRFAISNYRWVITLLLAGAGIGQPVSALPSYTRQTGQACEACHVGGIGPHLTPFGQNFKLGGYTLSNSTSLTVPLSAMAVFTYENTQRDLPDDAGPHDGPNDNVNLQEASVFVAGKLAAHVGSFAQFTYSDIDRKLVLDHVDVRYANSGHLFDQPLIFGISFNNNPTLQDPWNSGPAWRFPYTSSALAPTPGAATLINGGLEHQVLGASVYGMWNNHVYTEVGGYRSLSASFLDKVNIDNAAGSVDGTAPYWRLAYTNTVNGHNLMVGLFGLNAGLHPDRSSGPQNRYHDIGIDAAWQYPLTAENMLTLNGSYVHERQTLDYSVSNGESSRADLHLNEVNLNASWYFRNTYGLTLAYFDTSGTGDATLYAPDPVDGNNSGKPDSRGYIMQVDWTPFGKRNSFGSPWANVRVGAQYVDYSRFNGSSSNYDGSGRSAHDNNTLYLFVWTTF